MNRNWYKSKIVEKKSGEFFSGEYIPVERNSGELYIGLMLFWVNQI